jgi:hypothetical protein
MAPRWTWKLAMAALLVLAAFIGIGWLMAQASLHDGPVFGLRT